MTWKHSLQNRRIAPGKNQLCADVGRDELLKFVLQRGAVVGGDLGYTVDNDRNCGIA
jgi:hypothetical protein